MLLNVVNYALTDAIIVPILLIVSVVMKGICFLIIFVFSNAQQLWLIIIKGLVLVVA